MVFRMGLPDLEELLEALRLCSTLGTAASTIPIVRVDLRVQLRPGVPALLFPNLDGYYLYC